MKENKYKLYKLATAAAVLLAAAGTVFGCGTGQAGSHSQKQVMEQDTEKDSSVNKEQPEGKTEIRREDYPDCDGSGHGYTEIYYSDGSMETVEY